MPAKLQVLLFEHTIGELALINGRLSFQYSAQWLASPASTPLSLSLPLQPLAFDDHACRPFFAGLLPEGMMRRTLSQAFQISRQNDFALLKLIGGECAGAVSLVLSDQSESLPSHTVDQAPRWLDDDPLVALLDELPRRPMLAGQDGLRLSLAGAQDKLPVVFDGQRIGLPAAGTPSTHILKPPIAAVADSVANEAFCLALAQAMGLPTAHASQLHIAGRSMLLVARYDRAQIPETDVPQRLHQEDFCQALAVLPDNKYQHEGGPDLAQCFSLLRRATRPAAPQVLHLLDAVIFNALIGNHDAHAKNFSLLYRDGRPVLAPFYDLLSTAVYPSLTPKMAMKIGGKYRFGELYARHWDRFADQAGLAKAPTRKRVLAIAKSLPSIARKLQADPSRGFMNQHIVQQIIDLLDQRCHLTQQRLATPSDSEPSST